jgi:hypothetical protein
MKRRSTHVSGWVNFPVDDPSWKNTNEGGMVVKLVVCDNREFDKRFSVCCGGEITDLMTESLVGDDRRPQPVHAENYGSAEAILEERKAIEAWNEYHFPRMYDTNADGVDRYLSRGYLAAIVMGTTGWSGWNESEGRYWQCGFDDLSYSGKVLYRKIEKLYPGCELHLLTFLDT